MRTISTRCAAVAAALALAAPAGAAAQAELPDSPVGRRAAALLETVRGGADSAAVQAFVEHHMGAGFREMPLGMHLQQLRRMHAGLGSARLTAVRALSPEELELVMAAPAGELRVRIAVEPEPPHLLAGIMAQPPEGGGAGPGPAPSTLDAAARAQVVDSLAALLERSYAVADTGRLIAEHLRRRAREGAYQGLERTAEFAEALTIDLRAINGDKHLGVAFQPGGTPQGGPAPAAEHRENYHLKRVEHLAGNVGYLKLSMLSGSDEAVERLTNALRFLEDTDAMILDLRGVPGGSGQFANMLISHFTAPDLLSLRVHDRLTGEASERHTLASVPGPRRTEVPLYVLVDGGSASAAEDVPFVLQNLGRATIIGARTAGAGRNNLHETLGHGLVASVSFTRVVDPETGREWEGTGVRPDVEVAPERALEAAHLHALERLARAAEGARSGELAAVREFVRAQYEPEHVPAAELASYAGRYAGGRSVHVEDGRLLYQPREGLPPMPLVPLGGGRFALGPTGRVAFTPGADGRIQLAVNAGGLDAVYPRLP